MVKIAGNYPNVPSWRFAYDRDGTQVFSVGATVTQLSGPQVITLNNENDDYVQSSWGTCCFIFPELRDVDGIFISSNGAYGNPDTWRVQTSVDTTNGVDGTWVTLINGLGSYNYTSPVYRGNITSCTGLAVKAVKIVVTATDYNNPALHGVHLYGEIAPTVNPNRLILWHPTSNAHVVSAYFDWGNVPRASSQSRTFRVKNNSSTLTANSIRVAMDILTDTSPSVVGQHTLSTDGSTFLAQVNIGNLAPGAISSPITLMRVTPSNAVLSLWCHRVFAEAATWS